MEKNNNIKNYELFVKFTETNDTDTRNKIFETYKYLPEIIARKYVNRGIEYEDIYQVAFLGLLYAINRFDVNRGFEFTSFATPTILGEIKKYFRDKGWSVKVPRKMQDMSKKVSVAKSDLSFELMRAPTIQELSKYLEISEEEVIEALEAGKLFVSQSLNITFDNGNSNKKLELIDIIPTKENGYELFENKEFVENALDKLNKLERKIIEDRYFQDKTQNEIAKELDISQMTVSRIERKTITKIKELYEHEEIF